MTTSDGAIGYRFCGYLLDVRQRKLFGPEGAPVSVSSRAFDTLLELLARHGETLSKAVLMEAVWPNAVVEENNLNQAIYSLRKVLGDTKNEHNFILTVPGRGYCFVAPVEVCNLNDADDADIAAPLSEAAAPEPRSEAAPGLPPAEVRRGAIVTVPRFTLAVLLLAAGVSLYLFRQDAMTVQAPDDASESATIASVASKPLNVIANSVAVLPFTNLNADEENTLFSVGLHDQVINQLSKISSLKVIARNSVLALADQQLPMLEIARLLRVQSMMSGTILVSGEQARISLQMLDAATGITLWAETYEANLADMVEMISIQGDIAMHVASALETEIDQSEKDRIAALPTASFEAYRYNQAAEQARYRQDYEQEWKLSRRAIEIEPDYFEALYTFSSVNTLLVSMPLEGMTSREHMALALDGAERVIAIAPDRSEGYVLKAMALSTTKDWMGVSKVLEKLDDMNVPLSDLNLVAMVLMCLGEFDRAIEIYDANLETEPLNLFGRGFLMAAHELAGNRNASRHEYDIGEELAPVWWGDTVNIFLALGRKESLRGIDDLVGVSDELKYLLKNLHDAKLVENSLHAFRQQDDKASVAALYYAAIAAHAGEDELSVELMRFALGEVWTSLFWLWLPVFDDVRDLESFRQLLRDSGVVDYWRQKGWPEVCQPKGDTFVCQWQAYPKLSSTL